MITPLVKPTGKMKKKAPIKPKTPSISALKTKADRLLQELGRFTYVACMVCGGRYSCLHHFVMKSQSNRLRYDWDNSIPVCVNCHSSIHVNMNDLTAGKIALKKGKAWVEKMEQQKKDGLKFTKQFLLAKIEELEKGIEEKKKRR